MKNSSVEQDPSVGEGIAQQESLEISAKSEVLVDGGCLMEASSREITRIVVPSKNSSREKPNKYVSKDKYPLAVVKTYAATKLHRAVLCESIEQVKSLLTAGVDVDGMGRDSFTALHFAGRIGSAEIVQCLLDYKAKVTLNDKKDTVWTMAARYNHVGIMQIFLSTNGTKNLLVEPSPLCSAARLCHVEIVRLLFDAARTETAVIIDAPERQGEEQMVISPKEKLQKRYTKIMESAALGGNTEILTLFLEAGASPAVLAAACTCGHVTAATHLVKSGAKIDGDGKGFFGDVPLIEACKAKSVEIVEMLLEHGADVTKKDSSRQFGALEVCTKCGLDHFVSILVEHEKRTKGWKVVREERTFFRLPSNLFLLVCAFPICMYISQGSLSAESWGFLMSSKRPHLYFSSLCEGFLAMVPGGSEDFNGDALDFIPIKSCYVSCAEDASKRFICQVKGDVNDTDIQLVSDFLLSSMSWRFRLQKGINVLGAGGTHVLGSTSIPTPIRPITYFLGSLLVLILFFLLLPFVIIIWTTQTARTAQPSIFKMTSPTALHPDFLQSMIAAADKMGTPEPVFVETTVTALVEFHWCLYGQFSHTCSLIFFVTQLFLFTLLIAVFGGLVASGGTGKVIGWFLQGVLFLMMVYSVVIERRTCKKIGWSHFKSPWTLISLLASVLVVTGQVLYLSHGVPNSSVDITNSCAAVLQWFNLLYYLLPYESTGPLVRMILMIISDIKAFLMILLIVIVGFAAAFYSIVGYTDTSNCDGITQSTDYDLCVAVVQDNAPGTFSTPGLALRSSFSTMFGDYDLQGLDDYPSPVMLTLLWVAFMVIVSIVLLNILIAIISDSFERLIEGSKPAWLLGKAKAIMKMHTLLSDKSKRELDEYLKDRTALYILLPEADNSTSGNVDWNGRVSAIVNRVKESTTDIRNEVKDLAESSKQQNTEIRNEVKDLAETSKQQNSEIRGDVGSLADEVASLKIQLQDVLEALKHLDTRR